MECNVLVGLARIALGESDDETARELVTQASTACHEVGDDGLMVHVLYTRAAVAAEMGRTEQAVRPDSTGARRRLDCCIDEPTSPAPSAQDPG
jgi:hypothetical protein